MSDTETDTDVESKNNPPTAATAPQPRRMSPQNTATVTQRAEVHAAPSSARATEDEGRAAGSAEVSSTVMMSHLLAAMKDMQLTLERAEGKITQQQQQIQQLQGGNSRARAADSLPVPIPSNRYPPTAVRAAPHHRQSFGVPTHSFVLEDTPPGTPAADRHVQHSSPPAAVAEQQQLSEAQQEAERRRIKDALQCVRFQVDPFYADSTKDKGATVMDFVEKIETTMTDVLMYPPHYRLMMVRAMLKEGAMRWMNSQLAELTAKAVRDGRDLVARPIEWDADLRRLFINQYMGQDTVQLWLSKLQLLRLGSEQTPTPIELDSQFDTIARHVYPLESTSDVGIDLLLTSYYSKIVWAYDQRMYYNIVNSNKPKTMAEWKARLSDQFITEEEIRVMKRAAGYSYHNSRGGFKGRVGNQGSDKPTASSAAAMQSTDGAGAEGQQGEEEGCGDEQLTAAGGSRGGRGGGRGGRGGRGGGGGREGQKRATYNKHLSEADKATLLSRKPTACLACYKATTPPHYSSQCSAPANRAPTAAELN